MSTPRRWSFDGCWSDRLSWKIILTLLSALVGAGFALKVFGVL